MKKTLVLISLFLLALLPGLLRALTNEEAEGRKEIEKGWVDRHNATLEADVKRAVKGLHAKRHSFFLSSFKKHQVHLRRLSLKMAAKDGVPEKVAFSKEVDVPLAALYQAKAKGLVFLVADYADDWDPLHASSDIYIKIGFLYRKVFHGYGYQGCARLLTLGKDSPLFFETAEFGGGADCRKVLYILDMEAVKGMSDDLYDHPESVKPEDYIQRVLVFNVWLEGFTLYKDIDRNGMLGIVNSSQTIYPAELKKKLQEKYHQEDNDFGGPFSYNVMTVFRWNTEKSKFEDAGDYYF
ncbi:MAG TPA: hypothetical protein VMV05_06410 [bacterium]|nr:hypothetical protein [bacterium]